MDDTSGDSTLKSDFSHLNADMLHTVLELVSDGIWDWNANTGFVYRNPGWYQMLGYEPHSLGNTVFTWESVIHPDDIDRVMACFDAYLSGQSTDYRAEYRCRCRNGDFIWIEDRGRIIARNPDGSVARMISTIAPSASRVISSVTRRSSGPTPSIGLIAPPSTWYRPRNSRVRSTAKTSLGSSTTQIEDSSRRVSAHIRHRSSWATL